MSQNPKITPSDVFTPRFLLKMIYFILFTIAIFSAGYAFAHEKALVNAEYYANKYIETYCSNYYPDNLSKFAEDSIVGKYNYKNLTKDLQWHTND